MENQDQDDDEISIITISKPSAVCITLSDDENDDIEEKVTVTEKDPQTINLPDVVPSIECSNVVRSSEGISNNQFFSGQLINDESLKGNTDSVSDSKKIYKCLTCNISCNEIEEFFEHYHKVHSKKTSVTCSSCRLVFTSPDLFQEHIKNQECNWKKVYKCKNKNCSFKAPCKRLYHDHIVKCSQTKYYLCPYCNEKFTASHIMLDHIDNECVKLNSDDSTLNVVTVSTPASFAIKEQSSTVNIGSSIISENILLKSSESTSSSIPNQSNKLMEDATITFSNLNSQLIPALTEDRVSKLPQTGSHVNQLIIASQPSFLVSKMSIPYQSQLIYEKQPSLKLSNISASSLSTTEGQLNTSRFSSLNPSNILLTSYSSNQQLINIQPLCNASPSASNSDTSGPLLNSLLSQSYKESPNNLNSSVVSNQVAQSMSTNALQNAIFYNSAFPLSCKSAAASVTKLHQGASVPSQIVNTSDSSMKLLKSNQNLFVTSNSNIIGELVCTAPNTSTKNEHENNQEIVTHSSFNLNDAFVQSLHTRGINNTDVISANSSENIAFVQFPSRISELISSNVNLISLNRLQESITTVGGDNTHSVATFVDDVNSTKDSIKGFNNFTDGACFTIQPSFKTTITQSVNSEQKTINAIDNCNVIGKANNSSAAVDKTFSLQNSNIVNEKYPKLFHESVQGSESLNFFNQKSSSRKNTYENPLLTNKSVSASSTSNLSLHMAPSTNSVKQHLPLSEMLNSINNGSSTKDLSLPSKIGQIIISQTSKEDCSTDRITENAQFIEDCVLDSNQTPLFTNLPSVPNKQQCVLFNSNEIIKVEKTNECSKEKEASFSKINFQQLEVGMIENQLSRQELERGDSILSTSVPVEILEKSSKASNQYMQEVNIAEKCIDGENKRFADVSESNSIDKITCLDKKVCSSKYSVKDDSHKNKATQLDLNTYSRNISLAGEKEDSNRNEQMVNDTHNIISQEWKHSDYSVLKSAHACTLMKSKSKLKHFFKCMHKDCSFTTNSPSRFTNHLYCHKLKSMLCIYCLNSFKADVTLTNHLINSHKGFNYQCEFCFYRACSKEHIILHASHDHSRRNHCGLVCRPVNVSYTKDSEINLSKVKSYVCSVPFCSYEARDTKRFKAHLLHSHKDIKEYKCHECGIPFQSSQIDSLIEHYIIHNYCLFHCCYCGLGTVTEKKIHLHIADVHSNQKISFYARKNESDIQISNEDSNLKEIEKENLNDETELGNFNISSEGSKGDIISSSISDDPTTVLKSFSKKKVFLIKKKKSNSCLLTEKSLKKKNLTNEIISDNFNASGECSKVKSIPKNSSQDYIRMVKSYSKKATLHVKKRKKDPCLLIEENLENHKKYSEKSYNDSACLEHCVNKDKRESAQTDTHHHAIKSNLKEYNMAENIPIFKKTETCKTYSRYAKKIDSKETNNPGDESNIIFSNPSDYNEGLKIPKVITPTPINDKSISFCPLNSSTSVDNSTSLETNFQCTLCLKDFSTIKDIVLHLSSKHNTDGLFKCSLCNKHTMTKTEMYLHIETFHNKKTDVIFSYCTEKAKEINKNLVCVFCDYSVSFKHPDSLRQHLNKELGYGSLNCSVCNEKFMFKEEIEQHFKLKHPTLILFYERVGNIVLKKWIEHFIEQQLNEENSYDEENHINTLYENFTSENVFKCPVCYWKTEDSLGAQQHIYWHCCYKPFVCGHCEHSFSDFRLLFDHTNDLHKDKGLNILKSTVDFIEKWTEVIIKHSVSEDSSFNCSINKCSFKAQSMAALSEHLISHFVEMKFCCKICSVRGNYEETIHKHLINEHPPQKVKSLTNTSFIPFNLSTTTFDTSKIFESGKSISENKTIASADIVKTCVKRASYDDCRMSRIFICPHCTLKGAASDIQSHLLNKHPNLDFSYGQMWLLKKDYKRDIFFHCPYCEFEGTLSSFARHIITNHNYRYVCSSCDTLYLSPENLLEHHTYAHSEKDIKYLLAYDKEVLHNKIANSFEGDYIPNTITELFMLDITTCDIAHLNIVVAEPQSCTSNPAKYSSEGIGKKRKKDDCDDDATNY